MKPYRMEIHACVAVRDDDAMGDVWDRVIGALESIGLFSQGGMSEAMDLDDVIEGSPLDRALRFEELDHVRSDDE